MADPQIEKLLIVQHCDVTLLKTEQELARIPIERAALGALMAEETANIEAARQSLIAKEVARKDLDLEVQAKEGSLLRFRTQQVEVKKNEEYKALTHQIEQAELEISTLEEREIELMLDIDSVKVVFESEKKTIEARIKVRSDEIELLSAREQNLNASVGEAKLKVEQARLGITVEYIEHYDRVKKLVKRAPYVAPIQGHVCGGCHLRVSNEVSHSALDAGELHYCDQCARIVYA